MKIILIMDNGVKYDIDGTHINDIYKQFHDDSGVVKNAIMKLGKSNIYINPSHISSVEVHEEYNENDDDPLVYW